tara:strand:- start:147 stop:782 length:636 start_codon:yes stop_codon:yes gene_type:complete
MQFHERGGCLTDGRKLSKEELDQRVVKSFIKNLLDETIELNESIGSRDYVAIFDQDLTDEKIADMVDEYRLSEAERFQTKRLRDHPGRDLVQEIRTHPIHEESQIPSLIKNGATILRISGGMLYVRVIRTSSIQEEEAGAPASQSWLDTYRGFTGLRYSYEKRSLSFGCCGMRDEVAGKDRQYHLKDLKEDLSRNPVRKMIQVSNCGQIKP